MKDDSNDYQGDSITNLFTKGGVMKVQGFESFTRLHGVFSGS